ncbi:MAG: zonular occludens toxin [Alphaproteobacteria bacterium]|nr:MAG: zonular occludens toxin [Alphaproteobacteria bacterium]
MLTLITGLPGNGKTLYALAKVKAQAEKENRQVYYYGIKGIKLPWIKIEPAEWQTLPPTAILVIDEVQDHMPLRPNGSKVPDHINALAKHRHSGVDIFLITQGPRLLDAFVRELVEVHYHVVRMWGMQRATIHEFRPGVRLTVGTSRSGSIQHRWAFPSEVFEWYTSAEAHTHKRAIPMKVWLLLAIIVGLPLVGWFAWVKLLDPNRVRPGAPVVPGVPAAQMAQAGGKLTATAYVEQFTPRVPGLAYTAPVYDDSTKPVEAPYPAACIQSATRCQCYTQQGTRLEVPAAMCKGIAEGGFFVAWQKPLVNAVPLRQVQADPGSYAGPAVRGFNAGDRRPAQQEIAPYEGVGADMERRRAPGGKAAVPSGT